MLAGDNLLQNATTGTWSTANGDFGSPFCFPSCMTQSPFRLEVAGPSINIACLPSPLQDPMTGTWKVVSHHNAILGEPAFGTRFVIEDIRNDQSACDQNASTCQTLKRRSATGSGKPTHGKSLPRFVSPSARTGIGLAKIPKDKPQALVIDLESLTVDSANDIEITGVRKAPNDSRPFRGKITKASVHHTTKLPIDVTSLSKQAWARGRPNPSHSLENAVGGPHCATFQPNASNLGVKLEPGLAASSSDLDELPSACLSQDSSMTRFPIASRNTTNVLGAYSEVSSTSRFRRAVNAYHSSAFSRSLNRERLTVDRDIPVSIKSEERPWQQEDPEMQARLMANIGKNLEKAAEARVWEKMKKDGWVKLETAKGLISEQEKLKWENGAGRGKHKVLSIEDATKRMLAASEDLSKAKKAEERKNKKRKTEDGGDIEKKIGRPKKKVDTKGGKGGKGDFF